MFTSRVNNNINNQFRGTALRSSVQNEASLSAAEKLNDLHSFMCDVCNKTFDDLRSLVSHKNLSHVTPDQAAQDDRYRILNLEERYHFTMVPREILQFKCELCYRSFRKEEKLKEHMFYGHKKSKESIELPLECKECGKRYGRTYRLEAHIASVHRNEKNFICEMCSGAFTTFSGLQHHQNTYHLEDKTKFQCHQCGRILGCGESLKIHVKSVHDKDYKFKCPICNSGYQYKRRLNQHLRSAHTTERRVACTVCEKEFFHNSTLKEHMLTHGEREFKCKLCPKDYKTKSALRRHEKTEHIRSMDYHCDQCGRDFPTSDYLSTHRYHVHNDRKRRFPPKVVIPQDVVQKLLSSKDNKQIPTESKYLGRDADCVEGSSQNVNGSDEGILTFNASDNSEIPFLV